MKQRSSTGNAAPSEGNERLTRANGTQTYRALLDAALTIWSERGIQSVTMNAVAVAAHKTRGTVYHHFPTRDHLLAGVKEHLDTRLAALFTVEQNFIGDPYEVVAGIAADRPELIGAYIRDMLTTDPRKDGLIQTAIKHFHEIGRDGRIQKGMDPTHAALATIAMWFAATVAVSLKTDPADRHAEARRFAASFRHLLYHGALSGPQPGSPGKPSSSHAASKKT